MNYKCSYGSDQLHYKEAQELWAQLFSFLMEAHKNWKDGFGVKKVAQFHFAWTNNLERLKQSDTLIADELTTSTLNFGA